MSWTAKTTPTEARVYIRKMLQCGCDGGGLTCPHRYTPGRMSPRIKGRCGCSCHREQSVHDAAHQLDSERAE